MKKLLFFFILVLFVIGCESEIKEQEGAFLFDYNENAIESENKEIIDEWLTGAKLDQESKVHSYDMDNGYSYYYAKGYNDVLITYQRDLRKGEQYSLIKVNFKKGKETDEVFIEVKYNPIFCCDGTVIEDSFEGE